MTKSLKPFLNAAVFLMILTYLLPMKTVSAQTKRILTEKDKILESVNSRFQELEQELNELEIPEEEPMSRLELKLQPVMGGGLSPDGAHVPYIWIGPIIDIQQGTLCTFIENAASFIMYSLQIICNVAKILCCFLVGFL